MSNGETIYNRPFIDGRPVEGPEPFMNTMTLVEGAVIGAVGKDHWQGDGWTTEQMAHLVAFREEFPIDYSSNGTEYPAEAIDFPKLEPLDEYRIKRSVGSRAINSLIDRRRK